VALSGDTGRFRIAAARRRGSNLASQADRSRIARTLDNLRVQIVLNAGKLRGTDLQHVGIGGSLAAVFRSMQVNPAPSILAVHVDGKGLRWRR